MKKNYLLPSLAFLFSLASFHAHSEVRLPKMVSSHMVLQRDRPIHLWGWADPGEQVSASMHGASATAKTDDLGHWSLSLPSEKAGGPYSLTVSASNTVTLDDVLIGDVWFASGQSNMEFPLAGFPGNAVMRNGTEEIRNATQPNLRLLHVALKASPYPLQDIQDGSGNTAGWTLCTPETAANFSAVAYFFGREIAAKEHVPIGLIDSSWGGTPAEAWVSMDSLGADAALMPVFAEWAYKSRGHEDFPAMIAAEKREDDAAKAANEPLPKHSWHPNLDSWAPAALYNGMVAPLVNYPIKGVIWYQGESNSDNRRANMYERLFPALITDWRKQWGEGDFPFFFVQLANFKSTPAETWAIIRESQRRTLSLANTGMAVTIDIGNPDNVHPADKQDVGARLALAARAVAYGERVEDAGPMYRQTSVDGSALRVWFDHADGLVAKGGALTGFEVAGDDGKFVTATAQIDGQSIIVSSSSVKSPKYVRYGWENSPVLNLYNSAGLPASPFTSERDIPKP
jgi:sialate O-acetylesterase